MDDRFVLSVIGDVPVDNETSVVTSSISSRGFVGPIFEGAYKGRVCVHVFIGMSVHAL